MIVNLYVDGFNLYYGCLKGTPYKWLDLQALAARLLPRDQIHRIRYFTARISARPDDRDAPNRQDYYLRALATTPNLSIHYGRFQERKARMRLAQPKPGGERIVEVIRTDEKGSDVNLATYLLADAFRDDCEASVIVSNDADLAEPIRLVCHDLGRTVGIVNPHRPYRRSVGLEAVRPTFFKQIKERALLASQFPDTLKDGSSVLHRPKSW